MSEFFKKNLITKIILFSVFFVLINISNYKQAEAASVDMAQLQKNSYQYNNELTLNQTKTDVAAKKLWDLYGFDVKAWIANPLSDFKSFVTDNSGYSSAKTEYKNLVEDGKKIQGLIDYNQGLIQRKQAVTPEEKQAAEDLVAKGSSEIVTAQSNKNFNNSSGAISTALEYWIGTGCSLTNISGCFNYAIVYIGGFIRQMVAELLNIVGNLFDYSINFSIIEISKIANIQAVTIVWTVLRDFTNMFFIFMMLYIAIGTIVQYQGANYKTMIVTVITAAILINFSMAFVKIIIDAANIFAIFFYKAAIGMAGSASTGSASIGASSIAVKIINSMGFDNFLGLSDSQTAGANTSTMLLTLIGDITVMLIAVYILVEASVLLVSRTVMVIFYLAFSPLPYLAMIIPRLGGLLGNFWGDLTNTALYAPVYMALLYLVTQVLDCGKIVFDLIKGNTADFTANVGSLSGTVSTKLAGKVAGTGDYVEIVLFYIFASMLMLKATKLAKEFGIAGAEYAKSAADFTSKMIPGLLGGATAAAGGALGRNTLGRLAQQVSDSNYLKEKIAGGGIGQRMALQAQEYMKPAATGSFDVRASSAGKSIQKATGLDLGEASGAGGYAGGVKETKELAVGAKKMGQSILDEQKEKRGEADLTAAKSTVNGINVAKLAANDPNEIKTLKDALKKIKGKDILAINKSLLINPDVAKQFSSDNYKNIKDYAPELGITPTELKSIESSIPGIPETLLEEQKKEREEADLIAAKADIAGVDVAKLSTTPPDGAELKKFRDALKKIKGKDILAFPKALLIDPNLAKWFTYDNFKNIKDYAPEINVSKPELDSIKLSIYENTTQDRKIRGEVEKDVLEDLFNNGGGSFGNVDTLLKQQVNINSIEDFKGSTLGNPSFYLSLTTGKIDGLLSAHALSDTDRSTIKRQILGATTTNQSMKDRLNNTPQWKDY